MKNRFFVPRTSRQTALGYMELADQQIAHFYYSTARSNLAISSCGTTEYKSNLAPHVKAPICADCRVLEIARNMDIGLKP